MTIKIEEIKNALEKGLNPSKYIYLRIKEDGLDYFCNDFLSKEEETDLLTRGYIYPDLSITIKARGVLAEIAIKEPKFVSNKIDNQISFNKLHQNMQEELFSHIGKKQIQGFGGTYFIPSPKELQEFLSRFWKKYPECKEFDKIEAILLNHIEKCAVSNKYAPAVKYFIGKTTDDGYVSQLYGAYTSFDEVKKAIEVKIEPKDIKNLF